MNDREDICEGQEPSLKTMCPFCFSELDVHMDVKNRPYWRCWRCEARTFATKTAFSLLKAKGWIWLDERPVEVFKLWLKEVMQEAGLGQEKKK
jgi:hypothetical protein